MVKIRKNTLYISQDLMVANINEIHKKIVSSFSNISNNLDIDLKCCSKIDISGLSLIIEIIKLSKRNNMIIKFKNINKNTLQLAKVHGFQNILEKFTNNGR